MQIFVDQVQLDNQLLIKLGTRQVLRFQIQVLDLVMDAVIGMLVMALLLVHLFCSIVVEIKHK